MQCGQFERNNGQDNTNFSTVVYQHEVKWSQSKEPEGDIQQKEAHTEREREGRQSREEGVMAASLSSASSSSLICALLVSVPGPELQLSLMRLAC